MTSGYGISSIGMNPLGAVGLDYSGAYGSYVDPMMMNMTGMGGVGSYSMGGYMNPMMGMGMMGMYNPAFMKQMTDAQLLMADGQHEIEKHQLNQATQMHEALNNAEVANLSAHQRAIFQKITSDGDIQKKIRNLANVVASGDSDAALQEYEKLKSNIAVKYGSIISQDPTCDTADCVREYIYKMYQQISGKDLNDDILAHGETAFSNGFARTFMGNTGHNEMYAEEAVAQMNDVRLNDRNSKERARRWGGYAAKVTEGALAYGAGAVAGAAGLGTLKLAAKSLPLPKAWNKNVSNVISKFGSFGKWAKVGGIALLGADIIWQMARD